MNGNHPLVLMRTYAVEYVWPCSPHRYREAVQGVPEETARNSAKALLGMRYAFRVKVSFFLDSVGHPFIGEVLAAQWNRKGDMTYIHGRTVSIAINPARQRIMENLPDWLAQDFVLAREVFNESATARS